MKEEREKLANHIGEIQKTLREFLRLYYPEALPEDLRAGVQTLSKELSEWQTLQRRKEQLEEQPGAFAGADGKHPGGSFALSGAR